MNKKTIIILAIPIAMFITNNKVKASLFSDALSNYCVPTSANYCSGGFKATYNPSNKLCECKNSTYLRYNATNRHCEINCPAGSVPMVISNCGAGTIKFLIAE